jgi:hypothetical protein
LSAGRRWLGTVAAVAAVLVVLPSAARAERERQRDEPPPPGMKSRVFQIKHQDPENLVEALHPLTSGRPGWMMRENDSLRTLTVRDFPENIAAIEQAIKRLDVPAPAKPDVELRIHLLLGAPGPGPGQYPSELEPVIKQLLATLSYKSYYQVASVTQRIRAGGGASGKGQLMLAPPVAENAGHGHFHYAVENLTLIPAATGPGNQVSLKRFKLEVEGAGLGEAEVSTGLTLRDGERVVVGTGSLRNRAMIVVVAAKLVR